MSEKNTLPTLEKFWQAYLATLPARQRAAQEMPEAWSFGEGAAMADELGGLVQRGIKIATCSLLWEYEVEGSRVPQAGDPSIILDGSERPLCIIETLSVAVKAFCQVDAHFAYDEGEGDRSLAYWRKAHWHFFGRTCAQIGKEISEEMPLVCERFKVVYIN